MNGSDAQKGTACSSIRAILITNFSTAAVAPADFSQLICGQTSCNQTSAVRPVRPHIHVHPILQRNRTYARCVGGLPAQ